MVVNRIKEIPLFEEIDKKDEDSSDEEFPDIFKYKTQYVNFEYRDQLINT